jgi:hypothetical protein
MAGQPYGGGCDCGAGCCEESGWKSRLRGMFHRDSCDTGCDTCGSKHGFRLGWHKQCDDCTWTAPSCGCETGHESLFSKLKGRFHRNSCCETDCCGAGDGMHGAPVMAPKTEQIGAPKEAKPLPNGDKDKDKGKDKTTDKPPSQVQVPASPAAPTIIEIDPKNPF